MKRPDDMPVEEVDGVEQDTVEADELSFGHGDKDVGAQAGPEDDLMRGDEHRA